MVMSSHSDKTSGNAVVAPPKTHQHPHSDVPTNGNSLPTLPTLLGEALEVCIHELLYLRRVYPVDIFIPSRYLGVRYHAARHQELCEYIIETLDVACPALCSGVADQISLAIIDGSNAINPKVVESFVFEVECSGTTTSFMAATFSEVNTNRGTSGSASHGNHSKNQQLHQQQQWSEEKVTELEIGLRSMLLKIITLHGGHGMRKLSPNATFRLRLHTAKRNNDTSSGREFASCTELEQSLQLGKWCEADDNVESTTGDSSTSTRCTDGFMCRTLKSVDVQSCGLVMRFRAEVEQDGKV